MCFSDSKKVRSTMFFMQYAETNSLIKAKFVSIARSVSFLIRQMAYGILIEPNVSWWKRNHLELDIIKNGK
jgi:hypothetical protein